MYLLTCHILRRYRRGGMSRSLREDLINIFKRPSDKAHTRYCAATEVERYQKNDKKDWNKPATNYNTLFE